MTKAIVLTMTGMALVWPVSGSQMQAAVVGPSASVGTVAGALDNVRVYPNPWRSDRHKDKQVVFDRMPAAASIKIFNIAGQLVKTLESSESGSATWDLTTDGGDASASGIYLYLVTTDDGQQIKGKLALVR